MLTCAVADGMHFPSDRRTDNTARVQFYLTLGEEPGEIELALV